MSPADRAERDSIVGLVRETTEGLGRLVADHIELARVEMAAEARAAAQRFAVMAAGALVLGLGYALGCVAAALALAPMFGAPLAFAAVSAFHLALGVAAVMTTGRRQQGARPLRETAQEVGRTVAALKADVNAPPRDGVDGHAGGGA